MINPGPSISSPPVASQSRNPAPLISKSVNPQVDPSNRGYRSLQ